MKNKEIVKKMYSLQDTKNFKEVKTLLAPDYKFISPFSPTPQNADESLKLIEEMYNAFDGKTNIELLVEEGEYVAVKSTWTGKHVGTYEGVPATNKTVKLSFIEILRIQNGKVTEDYVETNMSSLLDQIGVSAEKAQIVA